MDGRFVIEGYVSFERDLERFVEKSGRNNPIAGQVIVAQVHERALRQTGVDDVGAIEETPLLAYLHRGRFSRIAQSHAFHSQLTLLFRRLHAGLVDEEGT